MRRSTATSTPSTRRLIAWSLGIAVAGIALWLLGSVLLLVFAAALLAVGLHGGAERIGAMIGRSPRLGLALLAIGMVVLVVGAGLLGGARLAEQGNQLWDQIGEAVAQSREWLRQYSWGRSIVAGTSPQENAQQGQRLASGLGLALMSVLGALASIVIAIVAALYFAAAPQLYIDGLIRLLPQRRRARGAEFLQAAGATLRRWLAAQGISMLVVAVASYAGLALLGVPMALLLAMIAGLLNFVPYIGPIVGAVPALLVALGVGTETALAVAALFAAIQFVEGNLLQPLIQKRMTHLPPALTILSQTLLGTLFGVSGVVLATPLLAVTLVGVRMLYVEDVLGDREDAVA